MGSHFAHFRIFTAVKRRGASPSRKTRLLARRSLAAASARGAQWWARQPARSARGLSRGQCWSDPSRFRSTPQVMSVRS
eukprot:COSAG06_NODE_7594_length_2448_cov_3.098765_1_plen_79_part_00